ncbi:MAG: efflux RND transporter periplasmic adaptor subunit, partial [Thermoanaerobaculia bacterium]|nr:efflux RND transporter periplasmic adaptor subunit [Thermoanaerobaculia bacterium]
KISLPHLPGEVFEGRVGYLAPELNSATRTLSARVEVLDSSHKLRPGMFVEVIFDPVVAPETLIIPSEAILRTGVRDVVIVILNNPTGVVATVDSDKPTTPRRFASREVVVGRRYKGQTEILAGLSEGELVVTSGQFLLDSEAQIKVAIQTQLESLNKPGESSP